MEQYEYARQFWMENNLDEYDYILLLPHDNEDFNNRLITAFNSKLGTKRGVIFTGEIAMNIMSLYTIYEFTNKLIIGSFDLPYGRKLKNLLDCGISSEAELIHDVLLGQI